MADGESSDSAGSWWGGWLATAKEKTEKVFDMVSKDMAEFSTTMQADTRTMVSQAKETLQTEGGSQSTGDMMKKSFSSFMEGLTKVLTVEPEDTSPPSPKHPQPSGDIFDRAKARLRAIQVDTGTYLNEPSGPPERFAGWLHSFDLDQQKGDISELLVTMVEVRSLYTTLVPSQVSHQDFWRRYFYKVHQLQEDEARKQALMKRADTAPSKEDSLGWDDDEWSGDEDTEVRKELKNIPKTTASSSDLKTSPKSSKTDTALETMEHRLSSETPVEEQTEAAEKPSPNQSEVSDKSGTQSEGEEKPRSPDQSVKSVKAGPQSVIMPDVPDKDSPSTDSKTVDDVACDSSCVEEKSEAVKTDQQPTPPAGQVKEAGQPAPVEVVPSTAPVTSSTVPVTTPESLEAAEGSDIPELKTVVKDDLVVVGTDRITPTSDSSGAKETSSGDDDWEQDFDIELTEEDMKAAGEMAKKLNISATDYTKLTDADEWDSWE